ncbi:homeodomain-interacting protein kinase 2-like [Diretmus argenteus]
MEYSTEHDHLVALNSVLSSGSHEYLVQRFLGEGSFGQVFKCLQLDTDTHVAIKICMDFESAEVEMSMMDTLNVLDPDRFSFIWHHEDFLYDKHCCLVFEMLDISLFDLLTARCPGALSLPKIRTIMDQLFRALVGLELIGVIHADIKLDNIMLVNYQEQGFRIKLIDFGCAVPACEVELGDTLQSLPHRAPEVLLGLPITEAIDMWSVGAVTVALFLCTDLYPAEHEYDLMRFIVETQGLPEQRLLDAGINTRTFFTRDPDPNEWCLGSCKGDDWRLKTPEEFHRDTGYSSVETRGVKCRSLDDLCLIHSKQRDTETQDLLFFVDLLEQMLHLDPEKRIKPSEALDHPFVKGSGRA